MDVRTRHNLNHREPLSWPPFSLPSLPLWGIARAVLSPFPKTGTTKWLQGGAFTNTRLSSAGPGCCWQCSPMESAVHFRLPASAWVMALISCHCMELSPISALSHSPMPSLVTNPWATSWVAGQASSGPCTRPCCDSFQLCLRGSGPREFTLQPSCKIGQPLPEIAGVYVPVVWVTVACTALYLFSFPVIVIISPQFF